MSRLLYLVRHGDAVSEDVHPERPLSEKGRREAHRLACHLKNSGIIIDGIWRSGKLRAKETAQIIAGILGNPVAPQERCGLNPDDPARPVANKIELFMAEGKGNLMIVGHLPFLANLAGVLLNGRRVNRALMFATGGCLCLEYKEYGRWEMHWLMDPGDLPAL